MKAKRIIVLLTAMVAAICSGMAGTVTAAETTHTLTIITLPENTGVAVDTYEMETGAKWSLNSPNPTDYRFIGWFQDGSLISEEYTYSFEMPDHDVTLIRRYVYDPALPGNPNSNIWYYTDDLLIELLIDNFKPYKLNEAIRELIYDANLDYDMVGSLVVKGKLVSSDFSDLWKMDDLKKADFSRTNLMIIKADSWKKRGVKTLILPSSLEEIEKNCFKDCSSLNSITCLAVTPPKLGADVFEGVPEGGFLYVPAASVDLYKNVEGWKNFIVYPVADELTPLTVSLPAACADGRCQGMRLEVVDANSGVRQKYIISNRMEYTFDLVHDCAYNVYLTTQQGEVLSQVENIKLGTAALRILLPNLKTLYDVSLSVKAPDGSDVTGQVGVKWFDKEGNYLTDGSVMTRRTEGTVLQALLSLPEELARVYQLPEVVKHTVAHDGNEIAVTLSPLVKKTLGALVVNDADGSYLGNASVQAAQQLHGRYNESTSAKTDAYGACTLTLFCDVPATLTVSRDGFYNESVNIENIADLEALPTVRLKSFNGTTVSLLLHGYDDHQDLAVSVYNNTKKATVGDARLQYPYLILPEDVDANDVLAITVHSRAGRFVDATQTMTVKDGSVTIDILANGNLQTTYQSAQNEAVRAMLYDGGGKLVETKKCEARRATFSCLPDGSYTVVMMGSSPLFAGVGSLADLDGLGLRDKVDYVKKTVTVQRGETTEAEFGAVPLFVESRYSYLSNRSSLLCTTANPRGGYAATFRAGISFKDAYADGVKNLRLIVDYDNNAEFVDGSVVLNTQLYDYAKGEQTVQIDGLQNGDEVKFCLMPKDDGILTAVAYVEFDYNNQHLRQPLGAARIQVYSVDMIVPEQTPTPELTIKLQNIPYGKYQSVEFYDNGVLIGSIPDLESSYEIIVVSDGFDVFSGSGGSGGGGGGRITHYSNTYRSNNNKTSLRCKLNEPYYYSFHNLQAKLIATDGTQLLTRTKTVEYNPAAFVLADVGIYAVDAFVVRSNAGHGGGGSVSHGGYLPEPTYQNSNKVDIGCISHKVNPRVYSVSGHTTVPLNYYVHPLHNDLMPSMLKDNSITLTKFYRDIDSGEDKTKDFKVKTWINNPLDTYNWRKSLVYLDDNESQDRFEAGENCSLSKLPTNFAVDYEYADDFEFPQDTEANNRYVKMLKAAMAERERLRLQLHAEIQKMKTELAKSVRDWDYLRTLAEKSRDLVIKLTGGKEITLTNEQEQLIEDWMNATTDAERKEIEKKACPDPTQSSDYQLWEEYDRQMMTSTINIPPVQMPSGVWTPSYTYIIGTPTTGHFLIDMSDGNWRLETDISNGLPDKIVLVNDKGGDRIIIDYSEHGIPYTSETNRPTGNNARRRQPSSGSSHAVEESVNTDVAFFAGGVVAAEYGAEPIARSMAQYATNSAWHDQLVVQGMDRFLKTGDDKLLDLAIENSVKNSEQVDALVASTKGKVGAGIGAAVNVAATIYVTYNNLEDWDNEETAWIKLIEQIKRGCGDNETAQKYLKTTETTKDVVDLDNEVYTVLGITTGVINVAASFGGNATGGIVALATIGADALFAQGKAEQQRLHREWMMSEINRFSKIPGCENIKTGLGLFDGDIIAVFDPSGYVYEAVPSNRLEGVTATCYYKDSLQNNYGDWEVHEVMWNAEDFDQVNPQLTDGQGKYGWDVPMGKWQVRYQKDGYEPTRSEWLPVPPPQLEVNIPMVQRTAPEVSMVHAYQDGVELLFSKYMQPETLTTDNLKVKVVRNGTETYLDDLKVELLNEEAAETRNNNQETINNNQETITTYASYLKLTSKKGWQGADEVVLIIDHSVKSYCGVPMQETFMQRLDVELRIEDIVVTEGAEGAVVTEDKEVAVSMGGSRELKIKVMPAEAGAGKTLRMTSSFADLIAINTEGTEVTEVTEGAFRSYTVVLDEQGEATVTLTGKTTGSAALILTIDGELATKEVVVEVLDPVDMVVKTPVATPPTGTVMNVGDVVTLSTKTEGAQIYYTTDGSCPCDETSTRKLYTAPIVITNQTVIKAMAVKDGWTPSEVATFVYTIMGDVNGDGAIDVADIATIISVMAGGQVEALASARADVNGDERVDIGDVATIIGLIGNGGSDTGHAPAGVEAVDLGLPSGTKWANMNVGGREAR